jgi:hypothetical protein
MANKVKNGDTPNQLKYSLTRLYEDITRQYSDECSTDDESQQRDELLELSVLVHMISVAQEVASLKEVQRREAIRSNIVLAQNNILIGYTCFLSSNAQFNYSWNYLRKQLDKYAYVLNSVVSFLLDTTALIDYIQSKMEDLRGIRIVLADLFEISFEELSAVVRVNIIWQNFEKIFSVQNGYTISALRGQQMLWSTSCKGTCKNENRESVDKLMELIHPDNGQQESDDKPGKTKSI